MNAACSEMARELDHWPRCSTPDCENLINHWLRRGKCYPCSLVEVGLDRRWFETKINEGRMRPWGSASEALLAMLERRCAEETT